MVDREKVICNLGILRTWCAVNPKYDMGLSVDDCRKSVKWIDDAIALLKAQEPWVMTAADFDNNPNMDSQGFLPAWVEYRRDGEWGEYWADDDDEWTSVRADNFEGYGYRCWTSRPTDAQREATPWE